MPLIVLICVSIHGCYIGSKVVVSLLALDLGDMQHVIGGRASLYELVRLALCV